MSFVRYSSGICRPSNRHFYVRSQKCEKQLLLSSCLSVRLSIRIQQLGSHWTGCQEICFVRIFQNSSGVVKFHENLTRITGTSHEDQDAFITSRSVILRIRRVFGQNYERKRKHTFYVR